MSRAALPQDYILNNGSQVDDFEVAANWTATSGTKEADTAHALTGTQSLKIYRSTSSVTVRRDYTTSVPVPEGGIFRLGMYLHSAIGTIGAVYFSISNLQTDSHRLEAGILGPAVRTILRQGNWVYLLFHTSDFSVIGTSVSWNTIYASGIARARVSVATQIEGTEVAVSLDDLRSGSRGVPRLLVTFDDGYKNPAIDGDKDAYDYLYDRGIPATLDIVSSTVGVDESHITLAKLQDLYAKGFAIAGHSATHVDWGAGNITTQAGYEAEISTCANYLIANGMPRCAKYMSYPGDVHDANALAAMAAQGMLVGREGGEYFQSTPLETSNLYYLKGRVVGRYVTVATVKGWVDDAIKRGLTLILIFHRVVETPSLDTQITIADYCEMINYIVARKIKCVTIDEWYKGLTNPRYRAVPLSRV